MIAVVVIIIITVLLLSGAFVTYKMVFWSPYKSQSDIHYIPADEQYQPKREQMLRYIDDFHARPYEKVEITSHDGLKLAGRYYHVSDNGLLAICIHGYRGTAIRDFCGGSRLFGARGQNILLIDQRAHSESGGHTITFGVKERLDCLDWINYAIKRFGSDVKIILYGTSMGAATVVMASGLDLPENVVGIVADSPYTSPKEIILKVMGRDKLSTKFLYPLVALGALVFGRFSLTACNGADAVKNTKVPILLIHGEDDRFVPKEMSLEIANANTKMTERVTFPDAGHLLSYIGDMERYEETIRQFCDKVSGNQQ